MLFITCILNQNSTWVVGFTKCTFFFVHVFMHIAITIWLLFHWCTTCEWRIFCKQISRNLVKETGGNNVVESDAKKQLQFAIILSHTDYTFSENFTYLSELELEVASGKKLLFYIRLLWGKERFSGFFWLFAIGVESEVNFKIRRKFVDF